MMNYRVAGTACKATQIVKNLSTKVTEDVQHALDRGVDVRPFVSGLEQASLAGLMEYGCLRWARGQGMVPPLPAAVASTELGASLMAVNSAGCG